MNQVIKLRKLVQIQKEGEFQLAYDYSLNYITKSVKTKKQVIEKLQNKGYLDEIIFEDIVDFHYHFEKIHPFQDGNGRVGRLIAFKECLRHNIIPFIIEDSKKMFYYRGLREWNNEKGFLIETCLDGQDTYKALLKYFEIEIRS